MTDSTLLRTDKVMALFLRAAHGADVIQWRLCTTNEVLEAQSC